MFDELELVGKYGSWVKVQVAFYDFIFLEGTRLCPKHWKEKGLRFTDGNEYYDHSVEAIERRFLTFENAWTEFIKLQDLTPRSGNKGGDA